MTRPGPRSLVLFAALLLPACEGCELLTGPEHQIRRELKRLGQEGYRGEGLEADFDLAISAIRIQGERAEVFARVDVEGSYRGSEVSCICVERFFLRRGEAGWELEGFPLARLAGVTDALEARRQAFEAQDVEAYGRLLGPGYGGAPAERDEALARLAKILSGSGTVRQEIRRRVLRIEARKAQVTEEFRFVFELEGQSPRIEEGRAAYVLEPTNDGWRFESGLL
ncbi:MAG: hypothetical protein P1V51_16355 [Deltaproteobacteria bacterium]|nr:hypothetical protein [Deltaproteobacteria bacterium]